MWFMVDVIVDVEAFSLHNNSSSENVVAESGSLLSTEKSPSDLTFPSSSVQSSYPSADAVEALILSSSSACSMDQMAISPLSQSVSSSQSSTSSIPTDSSNAMVISSLPTPLEQMANCVAAFPVAPEPVASPGITITSSSISSSPATCAGPSPVMRSIPNQHHLPSNYSRLVAPGLSQMPSNLPAFGCFSKFTPNSFWNALVCRFCGFPKSSVEELEAHIAWDHWNWMPFQCGYCAHVFRPTQYTLRLHLQEAHPDQPHKIICSIDDQKAALLKEEVQSAICKLINHQQKQFAQFQNSSQWPGEQQGHTTTPTSANRQVKATVEKTQVSSALQCNQVSEHSAVTSKNMGLTGAVRSSQTDVSIKQVCQTSSSPASMPSDGLIFSRILQQQLLKSQKKSEIPAVSKQLASADQPGIHAVKEHSRDNSHSGPGIPHQRVCSGISPMSYASEAYKSTLHQSSGSDLKQPNVNRSLEEDSRVEPNQKNDAPTVKKYPSQVECNICSAKVCYQRADIHGHIYEHVWKNGLGYRYHCSICGFGSVRKFEIVNHHRMEHGMESMVLKDRSQELLPNMIDLRSKCFPNHDLTVWSEALIKCGLCNREVSRSQKCAHLYRAHLKVHLVKCGYCSFTLPYGSSVRVHTAKEHTGLPTFQQSLIPLYKDQIAALREQCFGEEEERVSSVNWVTDLEKSAGDMCQGSSASSSPEIDPALTEFECGFGSGYAKVEDDAVDDDLVVIHG